MSKTILRIAVPSPLYRSFDYRLPAQTPATTPLQPGMRVRVPFGVRNAVGILLEVTDDSDIEEQRLKPVREILDDVPVLCDDVLTMTRWASAYYQYPVGEALATALPALLRRGEAVPSGAQPGWRLSAAGHAVDRATLARAPRQDRVLEQLAAAPAGLPRAALEVDAAVLRTLESKDWIESCTLDTTTVPTGTPGDTRGHTLNDAQQQAVDRILESRDRFTAFLLEGVTGSGKTEVYLQAIEAVIAARRQTLILVPEIGLTPQLVERFRQRFNVPLAVLHSGLGDRERLAAWQQARTGKALVVIGTRSAIFTPLARPGLLVVDEEHDASLKQQDGFRYSARDLAVWRARRLNLPVVLGSATPSLESLFNVEQQRYRQLVLPNRTGRAGLPTYEVLDIRSQPLEHGLSRALLTRIAHHLDHDGQVLLFLNRRGFAPTLICHDCGWVAECR
ncbi:MAG: primosomal protein N', partial [Gammaproteobacteria bacterium]|nr:primosomal protein N' [Gammaproteobacteria bacterium]